jgi:hypothetical protein
VAAGSADAPAEECGSGRISPTAPAEVVSGGGRISWDGPTAAPESVHGSACAPAAVGVDSGRIEGADSEEAGAYGRC